MEPTPHGLLAQAFGFPGAAAKLTAPGAAHRRGVRPLNHRILYSKNPIAMPSKRSPQREPSWTDIKAKLQGLDRKDLVALVQDLYGASAANRRFLQARFLRSADALSQYRRLVAEAVFPDPFSRRRVSLRDASAAITEYRRSTDDPAGTVDLMLRFVEAGTEQAADLGYGDEDYFAALAHKLDAIVKAWRTLPEEARTTAAVRLARVQRRANAIGWGFGDYVDEVVARLTASAARPVTRRTRHAV